MKLDENQQRLFEILMPHAHEKVSNIQNHIENPTGNLQRFVHYTSAEVAVSIIRENCVWMRKTSLMNDFMEIEHGLECLRRGYAADTEPSFKHVIDQMFPGISTKFEERFNNWIPEFKSRTFLTSFSEHLEDEDFHGRLSMWRAYGKNNGVAFVLNPHPFLSPSDALKAYSSPVAYLDIDDFKTELDKIARNIASEVNFLRQVGEESFFNTLFHAFRFAALCTKHPGFTEEREWRVIYQPSFDKSAHILSEFVSINGVPQQICKIPLIEIPEENFYGATLDKSLDRIIVGPSEDAGEIASTLIELLNSANVSDAQQRVIVSGIPLRT